MSQSPQQGGSSANLGTTPGISFSVEVRDLLHALMLHKALIGSSWCQWLARQHPHEDFRRIIGAIMTNSINEAGQTFEPLNSWNEIPGANASATEAARVVDTYAIETLRESKMRATEAYLAAGMHAPTEEIRRALVELADVDREHDDQLRELIGRASLASEQARAERGGRGARDPLGAHEGRGGSGTLRSRVKRVLQDLQDADREPMRLVLSPQALRNLRDEGVVDADRGTILGLSAEVDFGWAGECFAVETRDRASFAEILTSMTREAQDESE